MGVKTIAGFLKDQVNKNKFNKQPQAKTPYVPAVLSPQLVKVANARNNQKKEEPIAETTVSVEDTPNVIETTQPQELTS